MVLTLILITRNKMKKQAILDIFNNNLQSPFPASPSSPLIDPINVENSVKALMNELYKQGMYDSHSNQIFTTALNVGFVQYIIYVVKHGTFVTIRGGVLNTSDFVFNNVDIFSFASGSEFEPSDELDISGIPFVFRGYGRRNYDGYEIKLSYTNDGTNTFKVIGSFPPKGAGAFNDSYFTFEFTYNAKQ